MHIMVMDKFVYSIEKDRNNKLDVPFPLEHSPLTDHQVKVTNYVFEDSFVGLLKPSKEEVCLLKASLL